MWERVWVVLGVLGLCPGKGSLGPPREGRQVRGGRRVALGASLHLWSICEVLGRSLCGWSTYSCSWDIEEMELQTPA